MSRTKQTYRIITGGRVPNLTSSPEPINWEQKYLELQSEYDGLKFINTQLSEEILSSNYKILEQSERINMLELKCKLESKNMDKLNDLV